MTLQVLPAGPVGGDVDPELVSGLPQPLAAQGIARRVGNRRRVVNRSLDQAPGAVLQVVMPDCPVCLDPQGPAPLRTDLEAPHDLTGFVAGKSQAGPGPAVRIADVDPVAEAAGEVQYPVLLGVVRKPGDLLVEPRPSVQEPGRERRIAPARPPVAGFEEAVERGPDQEGVPIPRRERHRGQVRSRAQGPVDRDVLPAAPVILRKVQRIGGGNRHPTFCQGIHPDGGQAADRVLGEGIDDPAGQPVVALEPRGAAVEGDHEPPVRRDPVQRPAGGPQELLDPRPALSGAGAVHGRGGLGALGVRGRRRGQGPVLGAQEHDDPGCKDEKQ